MSRSSRQGELRLPGFGDEILTELKLRTKHSIFLTLSSSKLLLGFFHEFLRQTLNVNEISMPTYVFACGSVVTPREPQKSILWAKSTSREFPLWDAAAKADMCASEIYCRNNETTEKKQLRLKISTTDYGTLARHISHRTRTSLHWFLEHTCNWLMSWPQRLQILSRPHPFHCVLKNSWKGVSVPKHSCRICIRCGNC